MIFGRKRQLRLAQAEAFAAALLERFRGDARKAAVEATYVAARSDRDGGPDRDEKVRVAMTASRMLDKLAKTAPAVVVGVVALLAADHAKADPCTAELPPVGVIVSGQVRYVGDGDSLCIGKTSDPAKWIEIRLADFNAPEMKEPAGPAAKAALKRLIMGREATCRVRGRSWDRAVAFCSVDGRSVGGAMRAAGVEKGGN